MAFITFKQEDNGSLVRVEPVYMTAEEREDYDRYKQLNAVVKDAFVPDLASPEATREVIKTDDGFAFAPTAEEIEAVDDNRYRKGRGGNRQPAGYWTPERRAEQADRLRKARLGVKVKKAAEAHGVVNFSRGGSFIRTERMVDLLVAHEKHANNLKAIAKEMGVSLGSVHTYRSIARKYGLVE